MLFAPLVNSEATELLTVPRSFLERKIESFSDEQITCYLRKYYFYVSKQKIEEKSSWNQVKKLEKMIDDYQLREIARIPFMLGIMCDILPKLVINEPGQINDVKAIYPQRLSKFSLIDFFVDEVIRSITKESLESNEEHKYVHKEEDYQQQMDLQIKEIRRKAQNFALKLRGYATNYSADENSQHESLSALKLHPLVKPDNNHSRVKFRYPFLLEFFVAKSIEEEISQIVPSIPEDNFKIKKQLLINQRLLTSEASDAIVILFLSDAFKDERLTSSQFINLIYLSREKELNQENNDEEIPNVSHSSSQAPFTIAASNAITILNVAGYNFGPQDLTNINIPGVNLSFGGFEGTNFANSSLQGVNFTGAWLKDTNFVKANLESADFGATRSLKLQNEKIKIIAYSPDGKYFAVDVGAEIVIFEVVDMQRNNFKEIRRVTGRFLRWGKQSRTQVVTIEGEAVLMEKEQLEKVNESENGYEWENGYEYEDNTRYGYSGIFGFLNRNSYEGNSGTNVHLCTWDVISGESAQNLNLKTGNKRILSFNSERKEVITLNNKEVQKYDITSNSWIIFPIRISNGVKNYHSLATNTNMLLVGDYLRKIILCNSTTGKPILKQRQRVTSCKLSLDGQKIVATTGRGVIHISDVVRGLIIKSLITGSKYNKPKDFYSCSFNADGKQILTRIGNELTLQDIVDSHWASLTLNSKEPDSYTYCLHPDGQKVAIVEEMHTISFKKFPMVADLSIQTLAIRGANNEGLNLQGVIANSSFKLSEENIVLLQKRGDYGIFNENMIKKLFSNSSSDSEDVREVVLLGEKLAPIHAKIIGSDCLWINLQTLDLSRNHIGEDSGKAIGSNTTWANLEELILIHTEIGDETAKAISSNQKFQKLKKLQLAFNKIRDIGAESIGKNEIWMSLETLDLRQNKIGANGALAIGANNIWKKLETLDLSSNQISDKHILIFLCSNKTWEHLQSLLLVGNPTLLETSDFCKILGRIASKSLKMLVLPQAKFEQALLQYLKYSASENAINLSLTKSGYNDINAEIIAANTTFTNLKKLDLSKNLISDKGGIKIGSNTSWINLEELDLSSNNLGAKSAVAIGDNTTWSKLRVLKLNGNKIGTDGCYAIGNNKSWTELQTLELEDNLIGFKAAAALSQNKTWTKLQTLNLL